MYHKRRNNRDKEKQQISTCQADVICQAAQGFWDDSTALVIEATPITIIVIMEPPNISCLSYLINIYSNMTTLFPIANDL